MLFAPVLQEVAARMAGVAAGSRADPVRQAYRLRDAVALVQPDWVVTHYDPRVEADTVLAAGADIDLIDIALAAGSPVGDYVELTRILAALYPGGTVAASVTGPVGMVQALGRSTDDAADLLDCGDVLAELVSQYVGAGASRIVVWEPDGAAAVDGVYEAHIPLVRKMRTLGVRSVLCGGAGMTDPGYDAHALPGRGVGAALLDPECFRDGGDVASFDRLWQQWSQCHHIPPGPDGQAPVLLSDGPLPAECDMGMLRAAGRRGR